MKCYIELIEFSHQLSLKSYNELVFLLQLLLQDLVLFSPRILHTKHTQTRFEKKSQCALFKPSPPVWICSQVGGRKTAAVERWRCAFCAVVSLSSINFTWTSRHFPTTLCCQHPLCEAGGGEGGTEASRAAEEDRKAQEQNTASTNDRKELSPPKTTSLL